MLVPDTKAGRNIRKKLAKKWKSGKLEDWTYLYWEVPYQDFIGVVKNKNRDSVIRRDEKSLFITARPVQIH